MHELENGIKPRVWSVSKLNKYIRGLMESDVLLSGFFCEGEISNLKYHGSGHVYFSVKDEGGAISCVMWKSYAEALSYRLEDGMKIILYGSVSVYEKTGQYQIYVEMAEPTGRGGLYTAFAQLKDKLEREGLFDLSRKRPVPAYAGCVAVISSMTGAAVRDIINVARRRNSGVRLALFSALVQGDAAPESIISALKTVNDWGKADVIILARGGGSIEDLWAFNDESVARAVARSKIPVISAVGHQTDFTLCDFAADLRAETPSAASELAVFSRDAVLERVLSLISYLQSAAASKTDTKHGQLAAVLETLKRASSQRLRDAKNMYLSGIGNLERLSPLNIMKRGYSVIYKADGSAAGSVSRIKPGDRIIISMKDGEAEALIEKVSETNA